MTKHDLTAKSKARLLGIHLIPSTSFFNALLAITKIVNYRLKTSQSCWSIFPQR